ncbi:hypothetical protein LCGC14_0393870 [marine sediment metagenome]|uniref:Uncharacterized protein n=1 Tax=marine sediment metagenome TaxID=412755 RepID=A0A0F9TGL8_9ZZZZ
MGRWWHNDLNAPIDYLEAFKAGVKEGLRMLKEPAARGGSHHDWDAVQRRFLNQPKYMLWWAYGFTYSDPWDLAIAGV